MAVHCQRLRPFNGRRQSRTAFTVLVLPGRKYSIRKKIHSLGPRLTWAWPHLARLLCSKSNSLNCFGSLIAPATAMARDLQCALTNFHGHGSTMKLRLDRA
jgi:hypothetical protein